MSDEETRKPGRPRDQHLDEALLQAGLAVMLERGYHGATLTEIARRAGVGTPAIYRRRPTKAAMGIDITGRGREPGPIPDSRSLPGDPVALIAPPVRTWGH